MLCQLLRRVGDGFVHGFVVLGNCGVQLGLLDAQFGVELHAAEQWQGDGGFYPHVFATETQDVVQADDLQTGEQAKIHVRVEFGAHRFDLLARCADVFTRGGDIGA